MLGVLPGIIGVIQATEAIKWILGIGSPLLGRLLIYDALEMSFRDVKFGPNPDCPLCGTHPTILGIEANQERRAVICSPSDSGR